MLTAFLLLPIVEGTNGDEPPLFAGVSIRLIEGEMTFADVDGILHDAVDVVGVPAHIVWVTPAISLRAETLVLALFRCVLQS